MLQCATRLEQQTIGLTMTICITPSTRAIIALGKNAAFARRRSPLPSGRRHSRRLGERYARRCWDGSEIASRPLE